MQLELDEHFMRLALEEAQLALAEGNLPVGAVIVHNGTVISRGHNLVDTEHTDLAHAELEAIKPVQTYLFQHKRECEIYTTLEPCMLCWGAIAISSFRRLVVAASDATWGVSSLVEHSQAYRTRLSEVTTGVLAEESQQLIAEYVRRTGFRRHLLGNSG